MQETMLDINRTMLKNSDMIPFLVEFMILWGKESKQRMKPLQATHALIDYICNKC